jgi:hypothetical protein
MASSMVDDDDAVEMPRVPSLDVVVVVAAAADSDSLVVAAAAAVDDGDCYGYGYYSVERWTHDLA